MVCGQSCGCPYRALFEKSVSRSERRWANRLTSVFLFLIDRVNAHSSPSIAVARCSNRCSNPASLPSGNARAFMRKSGGGSGARFGAQIFLRLRTVVSNLHKSSRFLTKALVNVLIFLRLAACTSVLQPSAVGVYMYTRRADALAVWNTHRSQTSLAS